MIIPALYASQAELVVRHQAQTAALHRQPVKQDLDRQHNELRGNGQAEGEMSAPHLLLSGKAGLAATTPESTHINSGKTTALTAGGSISLATAKSLLATPLESINLYAHSQGTKLYAATGKVDIQAQSGDLDIIADKVLQIISAQERIHISAPKEIKVTVAGSYMALRKGLIEIGTTGDFTVHAAHHHFVGPNSMPILTPVLPVAIMAQEKAHSIMFDVCSFLANDPLLINCTYQILQNGKQIEFVTENQIDSIGRTVRIYSDNQKNVECIFGADDWLHIEDSEDEDDFDDDGEIQ